MRLKRRSCSPTFFVFNQPVDGKFEVRQIGNALGQSRWTFESGAETPHSKRRPSWDSGRPQMKMQHPAASNGSLPRPACNLQFAMDIFQSDSSTTAIRPPDAPGRPGKREDIHILFERPQADQTFSKQLPGPLFSRSVMTLMMPWPLPPPAICNGHFSIPLFKSLLFPHQMLQVVP
jgi:hypothetical protein